MFTTTYILNKLLSEILTNKTSYEVLNKKKVDYNIYRTFPSLCYFENTKRENKFFPKALEVVFLGYPTVLKNVQEYNPLEKKFPFKKLKNTNFKAN